jgi:hypothetical protein
VTTVDLPTPVAFKGVPDVELVAVGSWNASTGPAVITTEDLHAAVGALDCPGVGNPVLKLGHMEPDPDGNKIRWDGTPAVGYISNMRLSDNSAKLLGDYTGVPAWLVDAMPSAYPQRSVEITRNFLCQIGHTHPFVITAVSLLGIYPPAVGVIKSLQDVQALFTGDGPAFVADLSAARARLAAALPVEDEERRDLTDIERRSTADFDRDHAQWEASIVALLAAWPAVQKAQRAQLTAQIAEHVDAERYDRLASLTVDPDAATGLLYEVMLDAAYAAHQEQVAEARRQGVTTEAPDSVDEAWLLAAAAGIAATMAGTLAATAGRNAAQLAAPGSSGTTVAADVDARLGKMSDRFLIDQFGGAVGAARSAGRFAVLDAFPTGEYYASEVNDRRTCNNCRLIDGRRFDSLDEALSAYGSGGYNSCSGGGRCRGRYIAVWEVDPAPFAPLTFTAGVTTTMSLLTGGTPMPLPTTIQARVSAEDVSRAYYQTAGYSQWITAMHVDPLELVVCDDSSGDYFRVPVTLGSDDTFEFGEATKVKVEYVDVKTPKGGDKVKATAAVYADDSGTMRFSAVAWTGREAALSIVGGEPPANVPATGTNVPPATPVADDVSPAGAAIRKMAAAPRTPTVDPAAGSTTTEQEASRMPFDAAKLREALGLTADATADDALTAFAGALSTLGGGTTPAADTTPAPVALSAAGTPAPVAVPQLADGNRPILLDPSQLAALQASAQKGETAWAQLRRNERDGVIDDAIRLGKFPAARRDYWVTLWDRDPDGTRDAISQLAANVIPVLSQGYLGDDAAQRSASDQAYEGLFGKEG